MNESGVSSLCVWHQPLAANLLRLIEQQHLGQTLLFNTQSGAQSHDVVLYTAQSLLCQHLDPHHGACGQCHSCRMLNAGSHSDFYYLQLQGNLINVDQVRKLQEWAVQTPNHGHNKVAVISQLDKLTLASANALLKTLEEPRSDHYFLLVKPLQATVLATIISRAQKFVVNAPTQEQALYWLDNQNCPEATSTQVLALHFLQEPEKVLTFLQGEGCVQLQAFDRAVSHLSQGDTQPLHELLVADPTKLAWLGQTIVDTMRSQFELIPDVPLLMHLSASQLDQAYQRYIDLLNHQQKATGFNFSLQVSPLLQYLSYPEEFSAY